MRLLARTLGLIALVALIAPGSAMAAKKKSLEVRLSNASQERLVRRNHVPVRVTTTRTGRVRVSAGVRETMLMDFVKFARAKGLSPRRVIAVHVLKNIMIPVVTVAGLTVSAVAPPATGSGSDVRYASCSISDICATCRDSLTRPLIVTPAEEATERVE